MNRLKSIPENERPYEKAVRNGISVLSDSELLAVLLRTGTPSADVLTLSSEVLDLGGRGEGLSGLLHYSYEEYLSCSGIGGVKAVQLLAIGELARRIWRRDAEKRIGKFSDPGECARYYMQDLRHLEQEELRAVFLDTRMGLGRDRVITRGTVNASLVSVREIMIEALRHRAVNLILVHNHPSGDPSPSEEDTVVTEKVAEAGELVGITLSDHIIIGDNTYYSFKEWGKL